MAATGYTPIQLYYSTTAAAVPTAGNLASGELAINITDGKLYYKSNAGVVTLLAGAGGSGIVAGSNTQVQYNNNGVFGASANMTFNGTTLTAGGLTTTGTTSTGVLSVTGNTTLGDATADSVTVNGTITSNLIFTDNTYDIGASGATRPRSLYLGTSLNVGATGGVGTLATTDVVFRLAGTPAIGSGSTYGLLSNPTYSGTATSAYGVTNAMVLGAGATITNTYGFLATTSAWGGGATATNQYGFLAASTLTGATNNYGVASDIASGTNRWNFYASGTASNYFAGNTGIGVAPTVRLEVGGGNVIFSNTVQVTKIASSSTTAGNQPTLSFEHAGNNTFSIKGGSDLQFYSDNTTNLRATLTNAGNLFIGNASAITTGLVAPYLTVASISLGNQTGDNAYLRRNGSGLYQFQTAVSGSSSGSIELQPYAGLVGIGTGGGGPAYLLDMVYANNSVVRSFRTTSNTDYNGMILGAATSYGSDNNAQNKWSIYWRGRSTGNGHTFNLYDELNGRDVFNMTPGGNWTLTASSATADSYLRQMSWGDLGVCTAPTSNPTNPYPGFNFQGGGMVSPQVYDIAMHKNVLYNAGYKYTVSSLQGALFYVQNGAFTWAGTGAGTGTAGSAASVSDYMILTQAKNVSIGGGAYLTSGSQAIGRLYLGNGFNSGSGSNSIVVDNLSGAQGSSRTVFFCQGESGNFTTIRVQFNLRGAGGWCLDLNSGGTGGGGHFSAGGYINGSANYGISVHDSFGSWTNAAIAGSGNIFYVELTSNVGVHPVISGSITGSLGQDFGQSDITVTFS